MKYDGADWLPVLVPCTGELEPDAELQVEPDYWMHEGEWVERGDRARQHPLARILFRITGARDVSRPDPRLLMLSSLRLAELENIMQPLAVDLFRPVAFDIQLIMPTKRPDERLVLRFHNLAKKRQELHFALLGRGRLPP